MTTNNGTSDPVSQPFADFWQTYADQWNENTKRLMSGFDGSEADACRQKWLEAVSDSFDAYMRSPEFLQAMKHNLDGMLQAKQSVNDIAKEIARNLDMPTAGDISGLFERLHSIEAAVVSRLTQIEHRLDALEGLLREQPSPPRGRGTKKRPDTH